MVPIVYPITIIRVNAILPVFPWGIRDCWDHSKAFFFFPGDRTAKWGGRVLRKGAPCPLAWTLNNPNSCYVPGTWQIWVLQG